jgi:hypothetical protein
MTDCFLSLHGGSGVDDSLVLQAIDCGINKASVYTKISTVAVKKLKELLMKDPPDLAILLNEVRNGFREMIENRLAVFRSTNICSFQSNVCQVSAVNPHAKAGILPDQGTSRNSGNDAGQGSSNSPKLDSMIEEITKQILKNYLI